MFEKTSNNIPQLLTISQLSKKFDIKQHSIREWVREEKLNHLQRGNRAYINEQVFYDFLFTSILAENMFELVTSIQADYAAKIKKTKTHI